MTTLEIQVSKITGSHAVLRTQCQAMFKSISSSKGNIVLNFKGIEFMSRAFADELQVQTAKMKKKIMLVNVTKDIQNMITITKKTLNKPQKQEKTSLFVREI